MRTDLFDFELPPERIALRPASPRDSARLLVVRPGEASEFGDRTVADLPAILRAGDVLVVNDTRVIPARLSGRRIGRGASEPAIEATLTRRLDGARWQAFARPGKRLEIGDTVRFGNEGAVCLTDHLDAQVLHKHENGEITLSFNMSDVVLDEAIATVGTMPLPPYIASKRTPDEQDKFDYQTLFAQADGSVAAPTASLHFTPELTARLAAAGVDIRKVTLHVGVGTFLPVKADDTAGHKMHAEWGKVGATTAQALNAARAKGGRIVTVGSTALRLLESATDTAGIVHPFTGETDIFITPGYRFRAADLVMTNFHLPRSTLFMLVAAFSGLDRMKRAYAHAIASGYRFYSYGDACLLYPDKS